MRLLRHPDPRVMALGEPAREAHVIRMIVRDEYPREPTARERLDLERLPRGAALLSPETGIDDGARVAVFEQPEIDVVQLHRQRHPQPPQAVGDASSLAGRRRITWQVGEILRTRRIALTFTRQLGPTFLHARVPVRCRTRSPATIPAMISISTGASPSRRYGVIPVRGVTRPASTPG